MAGEAAKPLRFRPHQRIKQGRDFARLRQQGKRIVFGCMIANWTPAAPETSCRLGVVVSSKVGNSVIRSRVRRLLRESFRLNQHRLTQSIDLVLVARPSIKGKQFAAVENDLLTTFRKAGLLQESRQA
jgi:ribonuclease P protein component